MKLCNKTSKLAAAGLGALVLCAAPMPAASQGASAQYGRGDRRLEGQRFTTMRALAHRLDEAAQTAARRAGDTAQERSGAMRQRFLWAINDFARQARSFHERMDQYRTSPWDVADEVAALNQRATQVSTQIRTARAFPDTHQDWAQAVRTLNLMNRSLQGQTVTVPAGDPHPYQEFDERYGFRQGRHYEGFDQTDRREGYISGAALIEFRRLADNLTDEIDRAVAAARQNSAWADRTNRPLADLRYFAQRAADLKWSTSADELNSSEIVAVVDRMLADAQQYDRTARETNAVPRVEWAASIRLLEQMALIVRRR